jgi:exonuclease III
MKTILWNVEWAPSARKMQVIRDLLNAETPDAVCLTETPLEIFLPNQGHLITSQADYGYPNPGNRRKVALWSRTPWRQVDAIGDATMPPGRFVSGVSAGIRFVGVCIPWSMAHVNTGSRGKKPWEDHYAYLEGLHRVLTSYALEPEPICVLGDFNQRLPPRNRRAYEMLLQALGPRTTIRTIGLRGSDAKLMVDHIAATEDLDVQVGEIIERRQQNRNISDHDGLIAFLTKS